MLKFTIKQKVVPVNLEIDGTEQEFYLKEMVASVRDQYLTSVSDRVRVDSNGKVTGIKKFDGMQADLIAKCLYYGDGNTKDALVAKSLIQAWPASVVSSLFRECQDLNLIDEKKKDEEEAEKKVED